ncbi:hypothetical protein SK128_015367 [Halocaridina rubra]|uniref:Uncharacterized protein n=1 Tax=Halocaridina rubra TaxID=373956 RepID=A0AAN9AE10_HALRR
MPRLESTPILGERGLLLNLSPIATQSNTDDTAVLDNKENHLVENPTTPVKSHEIVRANRVPFSPHVKNTVVAATSCATEIPESRFDVVTRLVPLTEKLPSFTEVNFSDLTCQKSPAASGISLPASSEECISKSFDDDGSKEVRLELENILKQLDRIFPLSQSESQVSTPTDARDIVEAACELGDVLTEYVNAVPS